MSEAPKVCPLFMMAKVAGMENAGNRAEECIEEQCAFWVHEVQDFSATKSTDYSECSIPYMTKAVERLSLK
jgi:hypothetical protein